MLWVAVVAVGSCGFLWVAQVPEATIGSLLVNWGEGVLLFWLFAKAVKARRLLVLLLVLTKRSAQINPKGPQWSPMDQINPNGPKWTKGTQRNPKEPKGIL